MKVYSHLLNCKYLSYNNNSNRKSQQHLTKVYSTLGSGIFVSLITFIVAQKLSIHTYIFIAIGVFFMKINNFTPMLPHGTYISGSFGAAALLIFFAFTGFESIALAAEDMENPSKNIPRAIIIVMILVSAVYILIQAVSIGVLGSALANDVTPVATASSRFLGSGG